MMSALIWDQPTAAQWLAMYQVTPTAEIATKESRSVKSVLTFARKLYNRYPSLKPVRGKYKKSVVPPEYLVAHYNRGMSQKEIAAHFGIKPESVYTMACKYRQIGFDIIINPRAGAHPEGTVLVCPIKGTRKKVNGKWIRIPRRKLVPPEMKAERLAEKQRIKAEKKAATIARQNDPERKAAKRLRENELRKISRDKKRSLLPKKEPKHVTLQPTQRKAKGMPASKVKTIKRAPTTTPSARDDNQRLQRKLKAQRDRFPDKVPRTDLITLIINSKTRLLVPPEKLESVKLKYGLSG